MIEIQNLRKSYKLGAEELVILKNINLSIEKGEFVAIMGPSGSGKSTLMNILGLLDSPTSGEYILNGDSISRRSENELAELRRNTIGFIFQQFNLLPRVTALENVRMPLLYSRKFEGSERALKLLGQVGLTDRVSHRPNELSGGQQQRVAIARSLINAPQIVFADEPTGNLDSKSQLEVLGILEEMNAQGITIIMVTHDDEVANRAKRQIRIRDGEIHSDSKSTGQPFDEKSNSQKSNVLLQQAFSGRKLARTSLANFWPYFVQGLRTLFENKVRTALSMLGILIGVGSVIAMLALGTGAQKSIEEQLSSLGSNLIMIRPGSVRVGGVTQESGAANRLAYEDVGVLIREIEYISSISGTVSGRVQVTANSKNWNTQVQGVMPAWAKIHNSMPTSGRIFTDLENQKRERLALIGETIRRELFGEASPIGADIRINRVSFRVIGILPEKGANSFRDQDDIIIVPLSTAMRRLLGRDFLDSIETEINLSDNISKSQTLISDVLNRQHRIPVTQLSDAFQVRNMADIQKTLQASSKTMSMLLAAIGAISLLVGGIGIMNIMLVSVTERTREIGLRKAVGAKPFDILSQFLSESMVISVMGGVFGILLGASVTLVLSYAVGWTTSLSLSSVLIAFGFSSLIGIVFGVYPARKASRLNPIDALRHD